MIEKSSYFKYLCQDSHRHCCISVFVRLVYVVGRTFMINFLHLYFNQERYASNILNKTQTSLNLVLYCLRLILIPWMLHASWHSRHFVQIDVSAHYCGPSLHS